jgi:hypothetical protein
MAAWHAYSLLKRAKNEFKMLYRARDRGVVLTQKRSIHKVREHFAPKRNEVIGCEMAF